jgi:hypothetical protein
MNCFQLLKRILFLIGIASLFVSIQHPVFAINNWKTSQEGITEGVLQTPSDVLQVQMTYGNNVVIINSAQIHKGYVPKQDEFAKDYSLIARDSNGKELYRKLFSVHGDVFSLPPLPGGSAKESVPKRLTTTKLSEVIPWNDLYATIEVQDIGGKVLSTLDKAKFIRKNNTVSFGVKRGSEFAKSLSNLNNETTVLGTTVADTMDITFIASHYTSTDLPKFHDDVQRFADTIAQFQPFSQYLDKTVFYYVDNTFDLGCVYIDRVITCNSALVYGTVQLSGAPYDRIVVIENNPTYGGATTGEIAAVYNGEFGAQGFVHEFGHALSRLADEYLANIPSESTDRNCYTGTPPNPAWQGIPGVSYVLECNFPGFYRSSQDSIMRTITATSFNTVSQYYLKNSLDYYTGNVSTSPTPTPSISSGPTATIASKPGDANGDGKVDGIDFVAWMNHYNQTTSNGPIFGDFDRSGKVDGVDFVVWLNNYGK